MLRALRRTPAFTLGAIVTIALTVGATTAIFSVMYAVLLRELPYRDADRLYWIWSDHAGRDRAPFNIPDFIDYRNAARTLSGFAGYFAYSATVSDETSGERVQGIRATANLFEVLGARSRIGRLLQRDEDKAGSDRVVVLTEGFWTRRFGADLGIVGRTIRLNAEDHVVIGVVESGFVTPIHDIDVVLPFAPDRDLRRAARNSLNFINGVGRLGEGVSPAAAVDELNAIAERLRQRFPVENARKRGVQMVPVLEGVAGRFRTALLTLFAAVGAVLVIACANLANLMLTRVAARRKEFAVEIALGSSQARIVWHVLAEALCLSLTGGLAGVLLSQWGVSTVVAAAPAELPRAGGIRIDHSVLMFSFVVSALAGVIFGVVPAIAATRMSIRDALHASGRGATAGTQRIRGVLIGSEIALAIVLVATMAMLARSFVNVQAVPAGFDPSGVVSARVTLPAKRFHTRDAIAASQRALEEQLASLPGVTGTGAVSLLPMSGSLSRVPFTVDGRSTERERVPYAQYRIVSTGYFATARIPLKRGRTFSEQDTDRTQPVAIVNEELATEWFHGVEAIGARLLIDDNDALPRPVEIVGIVGNVQQIAPDTGPTLDLYLPYAQIHPDHVAAAAASTFWIVRASGDPMTLTPGITRAVRRVAPGAVADPIRPMERYLSDAMAPRRFSLSLMAAFAAAALALALGGVYAVTSYSLSQRAREIAIRVALGASRSNIVRLTIGSGVRFVLSGIVVGTGLAIAATRLISSMLFGVTAADIGTFAAAAALVGAASILASTASLLRRRSLSDIALNGE